MGADLDREWPTTPENVRRLLVAVLELIRCDFQDPIITTQLLCARACLNWRYVLNIYLLLLWY